MSSKQAREYIDVMVAHYHPHLKLVDVSGDEGAGYYKLLWWENDKPVTLAGPLRLQELARYLQAFQDGYIRGWNAGYDAAKADGDSPYDPADEV